MFSKRQELVDHELSKLKDAIYERGDKLKKIEEVTGNLAEIAKNFRNNSEKLARKQQKTCIS